MHRSTRGDGGQEERQAALDSFKGKSATKQTASETVCEEDECLRGHTAMRKGQLPSLHWQNHQTDLTPAQESQRSLRVQASPGQVAGSINRAHTFP